MTAFMNEIDYISASSDFSGTFLSITINLYSLVPVLNDYYWYLIIQELQVMLATVLSNI